MRSVNILFFLWIKKVTLLPRKVRLALIILLSFIVVFFAVDLIFPVHTDIKYSKLILDKNGELLNASLSADQQWVMKASLSEVHPLLLKTFIAKEDKWFRYHPGVNPVALFRALWQNITHKKRVSGASTITMQVIRMLEPRERTFINKCIEMIRALQLELHFSKDKILELYINLLPYGGNIRGVKAACYLYIGQSPSTLSAAQIVTLVLVPNNPNYFRPGTRNDLILNYRNHWLKRLFQQRVFTQNEFANALLEPLSLNRTDAPRKVPHLARQLALRYPNKPVIKTFIDPNMQDFVENILRSDVNMYRGMGIGNASVILINNKEHTVVAYAGSAGFNDVAFEGQVDGVLALRSPGSALKPFLFAQAFDKGIITPRSILEDIPKNFNGYRPLNYDETFRGKVTAAQALALSLNLPVVELANKMGVEAFNEKLSRGGLQWIEKRKQHLGLSVVLGGCGVTLFELSRLYQVLAQQGIMHEIRLSHFDKEGISDTIFSKEACWMITEILTNLKRPDLPNNFDNSVNMPHIAWKTGTSYGRIDAWSIGYNPLYTVGVWVGNFDGRGVPELSGSEFATPILFKIFNYLNYKVKPGWFVRPKGLDFRLVCTESGLPPGEKCTSIVMDDYIPSISPNRKCNHLIEVFTNQDETVSYCRNCMPHAGYISKWYPNLSPGLISFYEEEQIPYVKIPPHNASCSRVYSDSKPIIASLSDGKEYIIFEGAKQQLQLSFTSASDVNKVFWYINDRFYAEANRGQKLFFLPQEGKIKISCSDDKGRNTDIFISVKKLVK